MGATTFGLAVRHGEPLPALTADDYGAAVEALLERTAKSRGYSSATRLASYVVSINAAWAAEAQAFVKWRDDVWEYAYAQLRLVQTGQRQPPTIDALIAELPTITWPS